jgi:hypothetical protein
VLRIGVTGHRALRDPAAVRDRVDSRLNELCAGQDPVTVVSALAEGADRLVVDQVLLRPHAVLEVILPVAAADYLADFADTDSARAFAGYVGAARSVVVAPGPSEPRDGAYERAGRAIADSVDVLLALWDGAPGAGRGGTAEIVDYALRRGVRVEIVPTERPRPA